MARPLLVRRPDSGLGNIRASGSDPRRNIDWTMATCVVILGIIGAFAIYSATFWKIEGDPYWFTVRQVIFLIVAGVVMIATMSFDYTFLRERAFFLYGCSVIALLLVWGYPITSSRHAALRDALAKRRESLLGS